MKRKRVITIEIERDVVVQKRERKIRVECPTCGDEIEVTIPPEVFEQPKEGLLDQVVKMVKESARHANHGNSLGVSESNLLSPASEPSQV